MKTRILLFFRKAHKMFFSGENCVLKILPNICPKHFMTAIQYRGGNKADKLKVSEANGTKESLFM